MFGVQKRILDLVPCNSHSLSLAGVRAAPVSVQVLTFLALERHFDYFLYSAHRWNVLKDFVSITVRHRSDSRCSSKAAALNAISRQLEKVRGTASEARGFGTISHWHRKVRICSRAVLRVRSLSSTDRIQKCLQSKETFYQALNQLGTLTDLIDNRKSESCARAICDAEDLWNEWNVTVSRRVKIRFIPGENASDAEFNTREEMHRSLREILDKGEVEISDRFSQLRKLGSRFGFLCVAESLVNQLDFQIMNSLLRSSIQKS
jgi:hypothetical protein